VSLFQNSVSFGKGFGKTVLKDCFSFKSKVAFPKAEVLEKPQVFIYNLKIRGKFCRRRRFLAFDIVQNVLKFAFFLTKWAIYVDIMPGFRKFTLFYLKYASV